MSRSLYFCMIQNHADLHKLVKFNLKMVEIYKCSHRDISQIENSNTRKSTNLWLGVIKKWAALRNILQRTANMRKCLEVKTNMKPLIVVYIVKL